MKTTKRIIFSFLFFFLNYRHQFRKFIVVMISIKTWNERTVSYASQLRDEWQLALLLKVKRENLNFLDKKSWKIRIFVFTHTIVAVFLFVIIIVHIWSGKYTYPRQSGF